MHNSSSFARICVQHFDHYLCAFGYLAKVFLRQKNCFLSCVFFRRFSRSVQMRIISAAGSSSLVKAIKREHR